jgi:hypothetical protein
VTDTDKIKAIFELFNIEVSEAPGSFKACGRRFFPNAEGEIAKITYVEKGALRYTATPEGVQ